MKKVVILKFGKRKFRCELKKVRIAGKEPKYTEKVFCKEIRRRSKRKNK